MQKKAISNLRILAKESNHLAQYQLFLLYSTGVKVKKDTALANRYLLQSAQSGYADAQYQLGKNLFNHKQKTQVKKWLRSAAKQGDVRAQKLLKKINYLQKATLNEKRQPVKRKPIAPIAKKPEAMRPAHVSPASLLEKAKKQTIKKAIKMPSIQEIKKSLSKSTAIPNTAKKTNKKQINPIAQYNLSKLYSKGRAVSKNEKVAFMFMHDAAQAGFSKAQQELAIMHMSGFGTPIDYKKAYHWADINARKGDRKSKEILKRIIFILNKLQ
jgi:TPR repeat protein